MFINEFQNLDLHYTVLNHKEPNYFIQVSAVHCRGLALNSKVI